MLKIAQEPNMGHTPCGKSLYLTDFLAHFSFSLQFTNLQLDGRMLIDRRTAINLELVTNTRKYVIYDRVVSNYIVYCSGNLKDSLYSVLNNTTTVSYIYLFSLINLINLTMSRLLEQDC